MSFIRIGLFAVCGASVVALSTPPAKADLIEANTFKNLTYSQSGAGGATITSTGGFFNANAKFANAGEFDTATLTFPGAGSPQSLTLQTPTSFGIGPSFPTQAAMDAAYPFGTYTISVSNSGTAASQVATLNYTADAYASNVPALTSASYDALQGLSTASSSLTLNFNAQSPSALATADFTFLTIFGTSEGCGFLAAGATSCVINPSALLPNHQYTYELDFSDRIEATVNGVLQGVDFDVRTDGTFTTAVSSVPVPAALPLFGSAIAGLFGLRFRRGRSGV